MSRRSVMAAFSAFNNFLALGINSEFLIAESINFLSWSAFNVRLNDEMHFTELTSTAGLLLVTIVGTGSLCDGLTIRNSWLVEYNLYLFVVLHTPLEGAEMEFTLTMYENLSELLALLNLPCRVFLTHLLQGIHHLLSFALIDGADSTRVLGVGIFDEVEAVLAIFSIEGVASLDILEFHAATDVACSKLFYLDTVLTCTDK